MTKLSLLTLKNKMILFKPFWISVSNAVNTLMNIMQKTPYLHPLWFYKLYFIYFLYTHILERHINVEIFIHQQSLRVIK